MQSVIDLVKSLSTGPCCCQYNMGRGSSSTYDPVTGVLTPGEFDRGPCTHRCMRCRAREALEADGIEYVKDDRVFYAAWNMMGPENTVTACKTMMGEVSVFSGTLGIPGISIIEK